MAAIAVSNNASAARRPMRMVTAISSPELALLRWA
jgi:hypothetical protein